MLPESAPDADLSPEGGRRTATSPLDAIPGPQQASLLAAADLAARDRTAADRPHCLNHSLNHALSHPASVIRIALGGLLAALLAAPLAARPAQPPPPAQPPGAEAAARIDPDTVPRPSLEARRAATPIVLDGDLGDPAWALADSTRGPFHQSIPSQGMPSAERTVVRVLYDDEHLYVGAVMHDSQAGALVSAGLEQDFATQDSDIFGFALDTYLDRQNAFLFAVNPAGALFDAQAFNDQQSVNRAWEGEVEVSTSVHEWGWVAEVAVPLTTLRFRETDGPQSWGINFSRRIRRISEDSNWAPLTRQFRIYKMSRAGTLTSLTGIRQGRNLQVKPFLTAASSAGPQAASPGRSVEAGLDLKWGVTPQLTLDLTALTDFSQVEVDEQQINLTRFSLFFPEKRDFFLENEGIFAFQDARVRNFRTGSGPQYFKLYHSRRIGLSDDRRPVPILGGARLTGRVGDYALGFLNMQTRSRAGPSVASGEDADPASAPSTPGENFTVVRLRRNILGSSDIGFMAVNRQRLGSDGSDSYAGAFNRTLGADVNLRLAGGRLLLNSYAAVTTEDAGATTERADTTAQGGAIAAFELAWRDPFWNASMLLKTVDDDFNPGVGFVARRGVRQAFATLGAHPQPGIPRIRELNPYLDVNVLSDHAWALESREVRPGLGISFLNSSTLTLEYAAIYERLADPTPIAGETLAAGEYAFGTLSASYQSDLGRPLGARLSVDRGSFYDGERASVSGSVTVRPSAHLFLEATAQRNRLTLGGRTFDANLFGARARLARDTRTFLSAFVQYNGAADELQTNVRFNLIHAPLSDVFVVYSERRDLGGGADAAGAGGGRGLIDRALTLKATRMLAF